MVSLLDIHHAAQVLMVLLDQGVMGGLLTLPSFLRYFPEIDTVNPPPGQTASHVATIQAITGRLNSGAHYRT